MYCDVDSSLSGLREAKMTRRKRGKGRRKGRGDRREEGVWIREESMFHLRYLIVVVLPPASQKHARPPPSPSPLTHSFLLLLLLLLLLLTLKSMYTNTTTTTTTTHQCPHTWPHGMPSPSQSH